MGTGKTALSVLAQMGCPPGKLIDFPYFIDLDQFPYVRERALNRPVTFGSCGRLHRDKGYDLGLRALAATRQKISIDFRYLMAGTGPEESALRQLAFELGISRQVDFVGWIDTEQLSAFYQGIDFFLHPARTEPFGVCIVEAMASGAIVIASDQTTAALDRINNGNSGFLHCCDDAADLAKTIGRALELSPANRQNLRSAGRASAESWPTARGVQIISELLKGQNRDAR
jgi:glycosyltransferase involved in cell wall biosynthesis